MSVGSDNAPYRHLPRDPTRAEALGAACGISAIAAQLLIHRGIERPDVAREYLDARLSGLTSPSAMADRVVAATRIADAIRAGERIVVFGDYDVDGTTSTVLLTEAIRELGGDAMPFVGDRFDGGYGLSEAALDRCLNAQPRLIVTCDCGSSDHARIARANSSGVDVIVIDHHLVPDEPLPALAFLNPHRPDCGYPYKGLCTAGLAFSIVAELRTILGVDLDVRKWLDLVALGTIADVAPLTDDNRRLVRAGLVRLAAHDARPAVRVLQEHARIRAGAHVTSGDVAFGFAPRLNAAGRLGQSTLTLQFLMSRTVEDARRLGAQIEALNTERRALTDKNEREAVRQVIDVYGEHPTTGVVVGDPDWHRGVVGIVAARLTERFGVPSVVVALDDHGHGSARSVNGFDVHAALAACEMYLDAFGGHAAAAGVRLRAEHLDSFREAFASHSDRERVGDPEPVAIEATLDVKTPLPTIDELWKIGPFGEANVAPLFEVTLTSVQARAVGSGSEHAQLTGLLGARSIRAFVPKGWHRVKDAREVTVVAELRPDHWRGSQSLELLVRDVLQVQ